MNFVYFLFFTFTLLVEIKCCEVGWKRFENKCFKYLQTKVNYKNAIQLCSNYNSTLASIHSKEEHLFIEEMARQHSSLSGVHWVWLGGQRAKQNQTNENSTVYDQNKTIEFTWQDGTEFNHSEWRFNCPDKRRDEDCILMSIFQSRPSHWCNYKCDTNQDHVICQKVLTPETIATENNNNKTKPRETELDNLTENTCDIGWTLNENFCYKFFEINTTWPNANAMCEKNNANLLSVNSEAEQMFVQNFLFTISGAQEAVWLGAKRKGVQKEFQWTDNSTFEYKNYAPHEPDFRNSREHCLAMNNVDEYFGLWLDAPCSVQFSVSCKKKARRVAIGCSNLELVNEVQKSAQMNDYIIQLLKIITTKLDEKTQLAYKLEEQKPNKEQSAVALEIKSEVDSIYRNSSLIRLSLHLSIFVSLVLIGLILFIATVAFRRRHMIKKPYRSIFSFKNLSNLSYEEKNLNSNEYEELLYNQSHNANPNTSTNSRNLSDKV